MKKLAILICCILIPYSVQAETHMSGLIPVAVYQGGSPFCSEASAGESLWSTGWAVQSNPQDVYADLAHHFGVAIWPDDGIRWYIATYWPDVKVQDVLDVYWGNSIAEIKDDIDKGWAVDAAWFAGPTVGHDVAVWGYEDDTVGRVTDWYYTNSWGNYSLLKMSVAGVYNNFDLRQVVGLVPRDDYVPSPDIPIPTPNPDVPHPSVPEPPVWALLLMGLVVVKGRYAETY
jgi:hypothetical protein